MKLEYFTLSDLFRWSFISSDVYHLTFTWPKSAEVAERLERPDCQTAEEEITHQLQAYHRELQGLQDTYSNCMKTIDADQPHVDVFAQGENTFRFSPYSLICACLAGFYPSIYLTETGEFISITTFSVYNR